MMMIMMIMMMSGLFMLMTIEKRTIVMIELIFTMATMNNIEKRFISYAPLKTSSSSRIILRRNIERSTLTASIALLVDSHGFLEYVDAVLLDERSSLNNQ